MADILFIKTSSLGDVVHHMPAITDARRHLPDARLAWVVEEDYAPLARLHPAVDDVILVATRRWRKSLLAPATYREIARFRTSLRVRSFDAAIDTQGLLRTALIARAVRGVRHGYDRASIREPLACRFYDVRHRVEWRAHAIPRNRALCGLALGYDAKHPLDYGLDRAAIAGSAAAKPYAVLIHATAKPRKLWADAHWVTVARGVRDRGFDVVLPWGASRERLRSEKIALAAGIEGDGHVPDRRPLDAVAALIARASFVIGVDTGLVHIAAALGVPLVAIFVDSEPGLTGPIGGGPIAVVGGKRASPDPAEVLRALDRVIRAS
ncbi:MAG TPA: lipopolysaccharide heptosyltransferase I [Xanthobacteraceae bacterium]|jgi:heptosyltransferase-1|nr:lipopolysaccharide heptosyltransferase I [Xanthobacteraceae bacterium]